MAKKFSDAGRQVTFAVSSADDFHHELDEYGLSHGADKPVVAARNDKDEKFVMQTDFRSVLYNEATVRFAYLSKSKHLPSCQHLMHLDLQAPCGLRGCKNRPAPFPGRMSYKATKPGLVLFYILACFIVLLLIRAPVYVLLILVSMCSVFWLF